MINFFKISYWIITIVIFYLYFSDRLVTYPEKYLIAGSAVWIILSIIYGISLAKYLITKGQQGSMM